MFKFPYTNLHELNLDWILEQVKTLVANNDEFNDKADYAVETADEAKEIAEQAAQATIPDGAVTTIKIADGAVTSAKLATNAVYSSNIVDGEVKTSDIAEGAVTTSRLLDGAVTQNKIFDGAVTATKLATDSVNTPSIVAQSVTDAKLSRIPLLSEMTIEDTDSVINTSWHKDVYRFGAIKLFSMSLNLTLTDSTQHYLYSFSAADFAPSQLFEYIAIGENGSIVVFQIYTGGYIYVTKKSTSNITNELFTVIIPVM